MDKPDIPPKPEGSVRIVLYDTVNTVLFDIPKNDPYRFLVDFYMEEGREYDRGRIPYEMIVMLFLMDEYENKYTWMKFRDNEVPDFDDEEDPDFEERENVDFSVGGEISYLASFYTYSDDFTKWYKELKEARAKGIQEPAWPWEWEKTSWI
jgi:hypothetical protein